MEEKTNKNGHEQQVLRIIWDQQSNGETWANDPKMAMLNYHIAFLIDEGQEKGFITLTRERVAKHFKSYLLRFDIGLVTIGGHHVALHNLNGDRVGIIVGCHPDFN